VHVSTLVTNTRACFLFAAVGLRNIGQGRKGTYMLMDPHSLQDCEAAKHELEC
jgi:hypothetical protein